MGRKITSLYIFRFPFWLMQCKEIPEGTYCTVHSTAPRLRFLVSILHSVPSEPGDGRETGAIPLQVVRRQTQV